MPVVSPRSTPAHGRSCGRLHAGGCGPRTARRPGGVVDRLNTVVSMIGLSLPGFVFGLLLILVVAVELRWLPAVGYTPLSQGLWPNLRTMLLPSISPGS